MILEFLYDMAFGKPYKPHSQASYEAHKNETTTLP
jgi:hypothetical protein